jgi:hypothetical protein
LGCEARKPAGYKANKKAGKREKVKGQRKTTSSNPERSSALILEPLSFILRF